MSACDRCGNDNRPGARFCGVCGNPLGTTPAGKPSASGKFAAPAPAVSAPTPAPSSRPAWLIPVAFAALAIVVGGTIGLLLAGGGEDPTTTAGTDDSSDENAADPDDADDGSADPGADERDEASDPEPTEVADPAPEPDEPTVRTATLYSNFAKLRTGPNIANPEVAILTREGASLQIIGRHQNGWYDVTMDGNRGWIFGAFVTPPPAGFRIIQARGGNIVLRDSAGFQLGITNESGPKALATGSAGNLWRVILPDGGTAYVLRSDVVVAAG